MIEELKLKQGLNKSIEEDVKKYLLDNKEDFYRVAYTYVKNESDALDIVQDSIYKALKSVSKIENRDGIKTWFYKILIHTAIDYIRKNKRYIQVEDDTYFNENSKWDEYTDIDLQKALDNLSPEYKIIIVLRYFQDMKIEDIAKVLNENINTVKTRMYTALKKLKISMED